jgi:CHASE2 domain-containing sensor protein
MAELTEQRLGYGFGLLGGALIGIAGLVSLSVGTADLLLGRPLIAVGDAGNAVVLFVVGGLAMFFAWLSRHDWSTRPFASGVLLAVLAVVGWAIVGIDSSLLALIGSLFAFLAGVMFLIEPTRRAAASVVSA